MATLDFNRVVRLVVITASLCVITSLAVVLWQGSRTQHLTLAAGASSGESYILGNALKTVVERHYPRIRITLLETGGTVENLQMLEDGRAQLATAQSDVLPGPSARSVAVLYDDTFQLLVPVDSPLQKVVDLRGKHIALAKTGGQFQSFLKVAEHFGLSQADFHFVGISDEAADEAFLNGKADAIFRVRAIGNPAIAQLVQSGKVRFLPIPHAAAMKINHPAFEPAVIPEGAYMGAPPIPSQDLPTVAVHRTFLARDTANPAAIRAITEALIERRQEMMQEIPASMAEVRLLMAQVRRPESQAGIGPALHPGALSFYDKDKPSFLLAHADYVGLILTVGINDRFLDMGAEAMDAKETEKYSGQLQQPGGGPDIRGPECRFNRGAGANLARAVDDPRRGRSGPRCGQDLRGLLPFLPSHSADCDGGNAGSPGRLQPSGLSLIPGKLHAAKFAPQFYGAHTHRRTSKARICRAPLSGSSFSFSLSRCRSATASRPGRFPRFPC